MPAPGAIISIVFCFNIANWDPVPLPVTLTIGIKLQDKGILIFKLWIITLVSFELIAVFDNNLNK